MHFVETDILVVGAGGAGLRAAVEARSRGARVLLLDKGTPGLAGTTSNAASDWMAFAAALGHADPRDSPREHWIDILVKGGLVCKPELARLVATEAPQRLLELETWGAAFDKTADGRFIQILSDGARFPRACGRGAETGSVIAAALLERARWLGVSFMPQVAVLDLLVDDGHPRTVIGALAVNLPDGATLAVLCPAVILATGGAGAIYSINAFPPGMTGDGYAIALRAGVPLVNMEFIQIGPTIVSPFKFALSGAFWRLSPRITNVLAEEFIPRYLPPDADVRDVLRLKATSYPFTVRNASKWVDVAIFSEILQGRATANSAVFLDVSHNPPGRIEREAQVPLEHLLEKGLDIRAKPVEFAPAVQHFNGGIAINENAATSLPGLFACGEVAGGYHGSDRPGGDALAAAQVFGKIAGEAAARYLESFGLGGLSKVYASRALQEAALREQKWLSAAHVDASGARLSLAEIGSRLGSAMWRNVSIIRTQESLKEALRSLSELRASLPAPDPDSLPEFAALADSLAVAEAVAVAALLRTESRGTHYRADCPHVNSPAWQRQILLALSPEGEFRHSFRPTAVPEELGDLASLLEPLGSRQ